MEITQVYICVIFYFAFNWIFICDLAREGGDHIGNKHFETRTEFYTTLKNVAI